MVGDENKGPVAGTHPWSKHGCKLANTAPLTAAGTWSAYREASAGRWLVLVSPGTYMELSASRNSRTVLAPLLLFCSARTSVRRLAGRSGWLVAKLLLAREGAER